MAIKKVKLNYMSAVSKITPVKKCKVSGSRVEDLDRTIRQKLRQNEAERAAGMEIAGRYTVR